MAINQPPAEPDMKRLTAERDADRVRSSQEILSEGGNLTTIADGDWSVVAVGIVVDGLLVVLELDTITERSARSHTQNSEPGMIHTRFINGKRSLAAHPSVLKSSQSEADA